MQDNRVSNIDVARVIKKLVGVPPWMRRSTQGTLYGRHATSAAIALLVLVTPVMDR